MALALRSLIPVFGGFALRLPRPRARARARGRATKPLEPRGSAGFAVADTITMRISHFFSASIILIASRTKSIFHWGKLGVRGAFIAASAEVTRAPMALNRQMLSQQRNGRPSFWERPSRALPNRKGTAAGYLRG
jgi:hypothetical protein